MTFGCNFCGQWHRQFIEVLAHYWATGRKVDAVKMLHETYPHLTQARIARLVPENAGNVSRAIAADWL